MKLLIAYGTLTNNTEMVAEKIEEICQASGKFEEIELRNVIDIYDAAELEDYDAIIIGTSTWSDGSFPPDCEEFMEMLERTECDISGKPTAFFGLGETTYETYNTAILNLREYFVGTLRVKQVDDIYMIDGYPDDEILEQTAIWARNIVIPGLTRNLE